MPAVIQEAFPLFSCFLYYIVFCSICQQICEHLFVFFLSVTLPAIIRLRVKKLFSGGCR